jgi:hypothetical protein
MNGDVDDALLVKDDNDDDGGDDERPAANLARRNPSFETVDIATTKCFRASMSGGASSRNRQIRSLRV